MPRVVDLTGKRFGRLTVTGDSGKRTKKGEVVWKCLCDCGTYAYVPANNLRNKTKSCGCKRKALARIRMNENKKDAVFNKKQLEACGVHDSTMECMLNSNPTKNNTTGVRGVYINPKTHKFVAHITYSGNHYYLGTFDTLELAKFARKEAEKKIWGKDLE